MICRLKSGHFKSAVTNPTQLGREAFCTRLWTTALPHTSAIGTTLPLNSAELY